MIQMRKGSISKISESTIDLYQKIKSNKATELEKLEFEMDIGTYSWKREVIIEKIEQMLKERNKKGR